MYHAPELFNISKHYLSINSLIETVWWTYSVATLVFVHEFKEKAAPFSHRSFRLWQEIQYD